MSEAIIVTNILLVLGLNSALWCVSVWKRDASLIDPWWPVSFIIVSANTTARTGFTLANSVLLGAVLLWGLRLWAHLFVRQWGEPEDARYTAFRERFGRDRYWWVSFFQVFLLQGVLALVISAPLQLAGAMASPGHMTFAASGGVTVFAIGFTIEAVADHQLRTFRAEPSNKGRVLDTGLWRYTRHPNYLGESILWWGLWLFALDAPYGALTLVSPLLMTFLLVKVSGVTMLDQHLLQTKPAYADYLSRTSAFLPRRPRAR